MWRSQPVVGMLLQSAVASGFSVARHEARGSVAFHGYVAQRGSVVASGLSFVLVFCCSDILSVVRYATVVGMPKVQWVRIRTSVKAAPNPETSWRASAVSNVINDGPLVALSHCCAGSLLHWAPSSPLRVTDIWAKA